MKKIIAVLLTLALCLGLGFSVLADELLYMVSYSPTQGQGTMIGDMVEAGGSFTLEPCTFTHPMGYAFKAWAIGSPAGEQKQPGEVITITGDTYIYAVWEAFVVSFLPNAGSGEMESVETAQAQYTLPSCGFTAPEGYKFKAWAIGSTDGEQKAVGEQITLTQNTMLYPIWTSKTSPRQGVFHLETTSNFDEIFKLYGLIDLPEYTYSQGNPAYINASTYNLRWEKLEDGVWNYYKTGRFTPGTWRLSGSVRIDGEEDFNYYELGTPFTLTVDGKEWTVEGKPYLNPTYSYVSVRSPEFELAEDPNVQPPVSVGDVALELQGYYVGGNCANVTVITAAPIVPKVLGFMKVTETEKGMEMVPFEGTFKAGETYMIGITFVGQEGYDIAFLQDDQVSLKEAMLEVDESYEEEFGHYSAIYVLDDPGKFEKTISLGDVNGDGNINAKDALEVLKHSVGKITLTADQQVAADVNKDNKIDAKDALEILKYSVGKPSVLAKA